MTFPAKFGGDCHCCRQPIKVGELIKARTAQPWVHDKCQLNLRPNERAKMLAWRDAVYQAGFTNVANSDFWERGSMSAWATVNEHFTVEFHVGYTTSDDGNERAFATYDVETVIQLCQLLTNGATTTSDDEFEAYRRKLLERRSD